MSFVSIIIPTFNRGLLVSRAINSILNQTYKHFEIIVVDDGSTDNTELILSPLQSSGSIKYFKTRNLGVSSARNFGVQQSSGNFLAFLDSDDEWLPHKLEEQFNFFKQNPALEIVYGQELWIRNGVRVNQRASHQKFGGWIFDKCVQLCFIAPSSVMFTKKLFLEMGGFDQDFVVCEDYDLWLKISSIYEIGYISNPIIIKHGGHEDQLSTKYVAMDMWRLKALFKILNIRKLSVEHIEIVMIAIRKKADLLMKGYQKHGNVVAFNEVEAMLKDLQE